MDTEKRSQLSAPPNFLSSCIDYVHGDMLARPTYGRQAETLAKPPLASVININFFPMEQESIGSTIRTLRKSKKLAQVEVAEAIGISRSHLTNIERGKDMPGRETLMAIAQYFEISLDVLAAAQGRTSPSRIAETEREAILLGAFRLLPEKEADCYIRMMLARIESITS